MSSHNGHESWHWYDAAPYHSFLARPSREPVWIPPCRLFIEWQDFLAGFLHQPSYLLPAILSKLAFNIQKIIASVALICIPDCGTTLSVVSSNLGQRLGFRVWNVPTTRSLKELFVCRVLEVIIETRTRAQHKRHGPAWARRIDLRYAEVFCLVVSDLDAL